MCVIVFQEGKHLLKQQEVLPILFGLLGQPHIFRQDLFPINFCILHERVFVLNSRPEFGNAANTLLFCEGFLSPLGNVEVGGS
jgi:hypothetical protein